VSISFGAFGVVMAEGPYVLVAVLGTNADGLFCVKSKMAEPPVMVYDPIEEDTEVVRVVVFAEYVDEAFDELVHKVLPVSFNTLKLLVLGGEEATPDQSFCQEFLDRHSVTALSTVNLGQKQARLQDAFAVEYGQPQQGGPKRRTRVRSESQSQTVSQGHKRERKDESESQSDSRPRTMSTSRGGHGTQVVYLCVQCIFHVWAIAVGSWSKQKVSCMAIAVWLMEQTEGLLYGYSCLAHGANRRSLVWL